MARTRIEISLSEPMLATHQGPVVLRRGALTRTHLRQGSLEGTCGQYCVYMAALVLGVLEYRQLVSISARPRALEKAVHLSALPYQFKGTESHELLEMLVPLREQIAYRQLGVDGGQLLDDVVSWMEKGALVVLGVESRSKHWARWVLLVGLEFERKKGRRKPIALLASNPDEEPSGVSSWNVRIVLPEKPDDAFCEGQQNGRRFFMQLTDAIAVWKRKDELK